MQTITPQAFVAKWRGDSRKERSVSQEHFLDICRMLGHQTPGDNRDGTFAFEAGVSKSTGKQGWADVWKKGFFAWEYKGPHADLNKAYQQIQQYRESLENPPLLIVCDIQQIVIHTNFTNTVKKVTTLTLDDLLTPKGFAQLRDAFYEPERFRAAQTTAEVTQAAAGEFSKLASLLRKYGEDPQKIAHFLIRLLFCLFAEDIGLLPQNLFSRLVTQTKGNSKAFAGQLRLLFEAMSTGGWFGADEILHFNGKLFDNAEVLELDSEGMQILVKVSGLDWSSIEPSILGTLFERSLDPSKRSQLGAHYTSRDDILLIVEPVLMAPLRRRWAEVQQQARDLAARRDEAQGRQATRLRDELQGLLVGFAQEIAHVRVLDPACGSGNFLYVALKELLDLEKEVIAFASEVGIGSFFPMVGPEQLLGIEINEYAHELAQVTVWIGYIQWLRDNGFGQPSVPILKSLDTIKRIDAVLGFDEQGKPIEPEWPQADVIIGNPPFLGGNRIRKELGDQIVDALFGLYEGKVPAFSDLVCYWFERAREQIATGQARRAGLIATNSIRGGVNRRVLERIKETGSIFMGWADRPWVLDGAAVRVSMVGFDNGQEQNYLLDGMPVSAINPDLTGAVDISQAHSLPENQDICFMGPSPKAPFDIDASMAEKMLKAPLNINGRPNSDVVRPVASAIDLVRHNRQKWTIDFGLLSLDEAVEYELPFEYVKTNVYPVRMTNERVKYAGNWWQYARPRPEMRKALEGKARYIATPAVAKHRIFVWMAPEILCNQGTLVFARDDDYFFGVLHSKIHELWALRQGTSLEDRPRYTPTSTFETFPFPWAPGKEPLDDARVIAISEAAKRLVELRDKWLNPVGASKDDLKDKTLTNLYNKPPTWLDNAHKKLDNAVFDAYGWPHDLSDVQILERLLALNLERASKDDLH
jgi:type II restriction/modification system DNA methylase subunit YeeA